jgi:hypothetical protein
MDGVSVFGEKEGKLFFPKSIINHAGVRAHLEWMGSDLQVFLFSFVEIKWVALVESFEELSRVGIDSFFPLSKYRGEANAAKGVKTVWKNRQTHSPVS